MFDNFFSNDIIFALFCIVSQGGEGWVPGAGRGGETGSYGGNLHSQMGGGQRIEGDIWRQCFTNRANQTHLALLCRVYVLPLLKISPKLD